MSKIDVDGYRPKHLSYSTVDSYRTCPKRFELQKVMELEQLPGLAAIGGSAFHACVEELAKLQFHAERDALDIRNADEGDRDEDQ